MSPRVSLAGRRGADVDDLDAANTATLFARLKLETLGKQTNKLRAFEFLLINLPVSLLLAVVVVSLAVGGSTLDGRPDTRKIRAQDNSICFSFELCGSDDSARLAHIVSFWSVWILPATAATATNLTANCNCNCCLVSDTLPGRSCCVAATGRPGRLLDVHLNCISMLALTTLIVFLVARTTTI